MPTWSEVPAVSTVIARVDRARRRASRTGRLRARRRAATRRRARSAGRFRREPPDDLARRHDAGRERRRHVPELARAPPPRCRPGRPRGRGSPTRSGRSTAASASAPASRRSTYPAGSTIRATPLDLGRVRTPPPRRLRRQVGRQASELEQPRAGLRHRLVDGRGCAPVEPGEVRRDGAPVAADEHEPAHLARDADRRRPRSRRCDAVSARRAAQAESTSTSAGCSANPGAGCSRVTGTLSSASRRPFAANAHAFVAEVPASIPTSTASVINAFLELGANFA